VNLHDATVWAAVIAGYEAGIRDGIDIGRRTGRADLLDEMLTDEPLPLVPGVWHGPSRTALADRRQGDRAPRLTPAEIAERAERSWAAVEQALAARQNAPGPARAAGEAVA
jgi:hypothetical protein